MLDSLDLDRIREVFRTEFAAPTVTDRILTLAEAMAYTKHESDSAFYRWCSRWRVTSASNGRFARSVLDGALSRESDKRRLSRSAPRRPRAKPAAPAAAQAAA
jgi:hypothetical protein